VDSVVYVANLQSPLISLAAFAEEFSTLKNFEISKLFSDDLDSEDQVLFRQLKAGGVDFYWECGLGYFGRQEFEDAIGSFSEVIRCVPNFTLAYFFRGGAYKELGKLTFAVKDFDEVIQHNQVFVDISYWLRGYVYYLNNNIDNAIEDFNQAIIGKPPVKTGSEINIFFREHFSLPKERIVDAGYDGLVECYAKLINSGQVDKAIDGLTKIIEVRDNCVGSSVAFFQLGRAYTAKGELGNAIHNYQKCISLQPEESAAYCNLGLAYAAQKKTEKAIENYTEAIRLKPDFAIPYTNRGVLYAEHGKVEEAITDHEQVIKLQPDNYIGYYNLGVAYDVKAVTYGAEEDKKKSIQLHSKAIELKPDLARAYTYRAKSFLSLVKLEEALQDFEKSAQLEPDNPSHYFNLGLVYEAKGEWIKAIEAYTKSVELRPDDASTYFNRKRACFEQYSRDCLKIIALEPGRVDITVQLAFMQTINKLELPEKSDSTSGIDIANDLVSAKDSDVSKRPRTQTIIDVLEWIQQNKNLEELEQIGSVVATTRKSLLTEHPELVEDRASKSYQQQYNRKKEQFYWYESYSNGYKTIRTYVGKEPPKDVDQSKLHYHKEYIKRHPEQFSHSKHSR
jgi:tetratricopeptide (TPR) repeat protein